ncbi:MAG: HU family DNA-binding protein [Bacteroidia bacterium]|nr:HU family DNA-binding protein [Bacteroidia bacterium]
MSEKLNLKELSLLLSQRSNLSEQEAEVFLKELFNVISGSLSDSDQVSIKDFGTFKLSSDDTENNAEKEIDFSPDKELEELVNKPFSHFEPTLINEGIDFGDANLTEEEDGAGDVDEDVPDDTPEENLPEPPAEDAPVSEPIEITHEPVVEDNVPEAEYEPDELLVEDNVPEAEHESVESDESQPDPITEEENIEEEPVPEGLEPIIEREDRESHFTGHTRPAEPAYFRNDTAKNDRKPRPKKRNTIIVFSIIGALALIGIIFFLINFFGLRSAQKMEYIELKPVDSVYSDELSPGYVFSDSATLSDEIAGGDSAIIDNNPVEQANVPVGEAVAEEPPMENEPVVQQSATKESIPVTQSVTTRSQPTTARKTATLNAGENLRDLAFRTLGHREFWVYIYLKNESRINDPNVVPAGSELILPTQSDYKMNPKDPYSIADARDLGYEVLRKLQ